MKRERVIKHEFVEFIPANLDEGKVYISIPYATATHLCCCGCGHEVVTPLSPTDWHVSFNGETISLYPSIGNWSFPCRSHYWITNNRIIEAEFWTHEEVNQNRKKDRSQKGKHHRKKKRGRFWSKSKNEP